MSIRAVKRDGSFEVWFDLFLEGRLVTLFLRASFTRTMFDSIQFVKENNAILNNVRVNNLHFNISVGDYLKILPQNFLKVRSSIFSRCLKGSLLNSPSRYFFVNYKLFYLTMFQFPCDVDFAFPIKIDMYRANTRL